MNDRITYCDVCECAECPRYGDDCDGDKRNDELISRADAIEAVADRIYDDLCYMYCNNCRYDSEIGEDDPRWSCYDCYRKYNSWGISSAVAKGIAEHALNALPSAEPSLKAIKRQIDEHWYLDPPSAERGDAEVNEVKSPYMQQSPNGADLISRADAIEAVKDAYEMDEFYKVISEDIINVLSALPSAEVVEAVHDTEWVALRRDEYEDFLASAEAVQGEWIFNPKDAIELMFTKPKCSNCGFESSDGGNFCPNCGARMKGGEDKCRQKTGK